MLAVGGDWPDPVVRILRIFIGHDHVELGRKRGVAGTDVVPIGAILGLVQQRVELVAERPLVPRSECGKTITGACADAYGRLHAN